MRNYTHEEDFNKNDPSENKNDFDREEGDRATHRENTRHPEMVHMHNVNCRVNTDKEKGIFMENGIDEEN